MRCQQPCTCVTQTIIAVALGLLATSGMASPIPQFEATALTGATVSSARLIGQPTILIVTPSRAAAEDTRLWANALRRNIDPQAVRVRDVLAIDLPFFMSERDALGRARERIPDRYHDQTWLLAEPILENALGIPTGSETAHLVVLNSDGEVVSRVSGHPTQERISQVQAAVREMSATSGGQAR